MDDIATVVVGRRTALGGMLLVGARLVSRVFDFATMLALGRILEPKDFGLVAIGMSMVLVVEAILELPLSQVLLSLPKIGPSHYDTAFTLSVLRSLTLALLLGGAAWPFAAFYNEPRLVPIVCVLCIAPIARGMVSPRLAGYQKSMSFWRDCSVEFIGKVFAFTVSITLALLTRSYWSIAIGTVAFTVGMAVTSYWLAPYRPRLSLAEMHLFSGFVGWVGAAQVISAINWQLERLLLGKLKSSSELGLFSTASDIANIPFLALFGPITRPLQAAFAHLAADQPRLGRSYQSATSAIIAIGLPLLVGESVVADPAVRLILGPKWLGAIPLVQWLALSLIPALFTLPSSSLFMALGETRIFVKRNLIEMSVKLPIAITGAILYGFAGVIAARLVSETVANLVSMVAVKRMIGLSLRDQVFESWRSIVSVAAMAASVNWLMAQLGTNVSVLQTAMDLAAAVGAGAAIYTGMLLALWVAVGRPPGIEATAIGMARDLLAQRKTIAEGAEQSN